MTDRRRQQAGRRLRTATALVLALSLFAATASAGEAAPGKPDCARLEAWAAGIDGKDRVQPVEGNRGWLPRAFQDTAFVELFGSPAMDWSAEQARDVGAHVFACGAAAAKAKRNDTAKALYAARGYIVGNLRGLLVAAERQAMKEERAATKEEQRKARAAAKAKERARREAERVARQQQRAAAAEAQAEARAAEAQAALDKAVEDFLAETDGLALLRRMAMLHDLDIADPQSYARVYGRLGYAGNTMLDLMRRNGIAMDDPRVGPRLAEREQGLRGQIVADYQAKVDALDASPDSLRFLQRWLAEIDRKLAPALGQEAASRLQTAIAEKDRTIRSGMLERAKTQIDLAESRSGDARTALERIDRIVGNTISAGLDPSQVADLRSHAATRQQALADQQIETAAAALENFPETLDGLQKLEREINAAKRGVLRHASKDNRDAYVEAVRERLTEVAKAALPEYERGLAPIPATAEGLRMTQATLVEDAGFRDVDEDVRADYLAALKERREDIAAAVREARKQSTTAALSAGGDVDLVGYLFVDREKDAQLLFRDERHVVLQLNGKQGIADYEVIGDSIRVKPPGIPFMLQRSGQGAKTRISGLGLNFVRTSLP